nr:heavy-metal-associated domain-containing protein [Clostridia bacterium]
LSVEGMMCEHCEAAVKKALEALSAVDSAVADYKKGIVRITLNGETKIKLIKNTIEKEGYKVK